MTQLGSYRKSLFGQFAVMGHCGTGLFEAFQGRFGKEAWHHNFNGRTRQSDT